MKSLWKKSKLIVDEIVGKVNSYESSMSSLLATYTELAEIFLIKPGNLREGSFSNPRVAEMYRAVNAISKMEYRMLTSQKPFFELVPMDIISYTNPVDVIASENYIKQQLKYSEYDINLLRALFSKNLFGTVFVEEPYYTKKVNFLGRKVGVTGFQPRSLLQVAFSRDNFNLRDYSWVSLADYKTRQQLEMCLKNDDTEIYNKDAFSEYINDTEAPYINNWIQTRLQASGFDTDGFNDGNVAEVSSYYGPLDTLNDGLIYNVLVINRKYLFRITEVPGLTPVRTATMVDFELEPLGYGIGTLLKNLSNDIDANRAKLNDIVTFSTYNMFVKGRESGIEDADFTARPWGIIEVDDPNGFKPLVNNFQNAKMALDYEMLLKDDFRNASGATNTLQAIVGENVTATEVSLAMNESVRNISVNSEMTAKSLVRDHIQLVLENGQKYQSERMVVNIDGIPTIIEPNQLKIDVDVEVRTMTDQNFRPARLKNTITALQTLLTIPPQSMPGMKVNIEPMVKEIAKMLDIPAFGEVIQPITEQDLIAMKVQAEMGQPSQLQNTRQGNVPIPMEPQNVQQTPAGEVLQPPGEGEATMQAIQNASTLEG